MYEDYDDGSGGGSSLGRKIALGVGVLAVVALGWFVVTNLTGGDDGGQVKQGDAAAASSEAPSSTEAAAEEPPPTTEPASAPTGSEATATTEATATPTTAEATTEASTTVPPTAAPTTAAATTPPAPTLAVANARDDTQRSQVINNLTINPSVPRDVGARVVELTSTRFPDGSATVSLAQAAELNRVVNVMNLLPNITALVIGHADQRGSEVSNYVLSKQRADAVVAYMVSQGVDPARLSSRAVGENDLLTLGDDAAALALNKRTEFVLFGLLLP
jgi:OOP family OmpA-OmpF porin